MYLQTKLLHQHEQKSDKKLPSSWTKMPNGSYASFQTTSVSLCDNKNTTYYILNIANNLENKI